MSLNNNGTHVYTGCWIDRSRGVLLGSTLTLSARNGGLLTSFIATFITVVGSQLWRIISFIIHQYLASEDPRDGIHHQRQVVFRNISSPLGASWMFLQQAKAWRKRTPEALLRTLPWAALALVFWVASTTAAVFSAEVSKAAGNNRLIVSDHCGDWTFPDSGSQGQLSAYAQKVRNDTSLAAAYARACYTSDPDPLQCRTYVRSTLAWASSDTDCPFDDSICQVRENARPYRLTTALLDSHHDLGINAPPDERVQVQKETICAPLVEDSFMTSFNDSIRGQSLTYNYGTVSPSFTNVTYTYATNARRDGFAYQLDTQYYLVDSAFNLWEPIPELITPNTDLTIVFISQNSVRFIEPCHDPIFAATTKVSDQKNHVTYYTPDLPVGTLACAEKYRLCNPTTKTCTPYAGINHLTRLLSDNTTPNLTLTPSQLATTSLLLPILQLTSLHSTISTRSASALLASELLISSTATQISLPPTHWHLELNSWFSASLARLQRGVLLYATGPAVILPGMVKVGGGGEEERALCGRQMVRDQGGTVSFSLVGLVVVFGVGGAVIGGAMGMEGVADSVRLGWKGNGAREEEDGEEKGREMNDEDENGLKSNSRIRRRGEISGKDYKYVNWVADNIFQLQRMAYESADAAAAATNTTATAPNTTTATTSSTPRDSASAATHHLPPTVEKWWTHTAANVPVTVPITSGTKGASGSVPVLFGGWRDVDRHHPSVVGRTKILSADGGDEGTLAEETGSGAGAGKLQRARSQTNFSSARSRLPRETWQEKEKATTLVAVNEINDIRQSQEPKIYTKFHLPRPPVALADRDRGSRQHSYPQVQAQVLPSCAIRPVCGEERAGVMLRALRDDFGLGRTLGFS